MATARPAYQAPPNPFLIGPSTTTPPLANSPASRRRQRPGSVSTGRTALNRGTFGVQPPTALQQSISEATVEAQLAARKQKKKTGSASAGRVQPTGGLPTSLSMPILTPVSLIGI
jgi:hypothetical protein